MNDLKNSAHVNYDGIREYETDISYFKNLKNAILSDNVNVLKIARIGDTYSKYGLYLPYFERVFSAIPPKIGSQRACHILAISIITEITAGASPTTSE